MLAMEVVSEHCAQSGDDANTIRDAMDRVAKHRWGWRWERAKEKAQEGPNDER